MGQTLKTHVAAGWIVGGQAGRARGSTRNVANLLVGGCAVSMMSPNGNAVRGLS